MMEDDEDGEEDTQEKEKEKDIYQQYGEEEDFLKNSTPPKSPKESKTKRKALNLNQMYGEGSES